MNIPFDMTWSIGQDLREVPNNPSEFKDGIRFLESHLKDLEGIELIRSQSKLGVLLRICGCLEKSQRQLLIARNSLSLITDKRLSLINELRIAQTAQWSNDFQTSNKIYVELETQIESDTSNSDLLDFVYQHKGKNDFDQGEFGLAIEMFNRALQLRLSKGDEELINSTQFALDQANHQSNK